MAKGHQGAGKLQRVLRVFQSTNQEPKRLSTSLLFNIHLPALSPPALPEETFRLIERILLILCLRWEMFS